MEKENIYLQIKQLHDLPSPFTINFLNFVKVPALCNSSFSVFQSRLPLNERESGPYLFVCACGSLNST